VASHKKGGIMNRLILLPILILVVPCVLHAQINWGEYIIDADFDGACSVYAIDLDGDGDVDVLGAAKDAWDIAWWENDGNENFIKHTIDVSFRYASSVYAIDLDSDGDVDVLGASDNQYDNQHDIIWWENDGDENFTAHIIDDSFNHAVSVYAIDLDSDGDVDILGAAYMAVPANIAWWENDGSENFTKHIIDDNFSNARSVYAIDLDGDEDIDVLGAASGADDIAWWENDGSENFAKHIIDDDFSNARSVYAIDLDGDEDIDVLGAASGADDIAWWENDGSENFAKHIIDDNFDGAWSVYAIDLDNDGDIDVLGAAYNAWDIAWWENDGDENFTKYIIGDGFTNACSVYAIDLDDDGDIDVLGAASGADEITWWQSFLVGVDVGTASIDITPAVLAGTVLSPQATVKNFGSETANFDVVCQIAPNAYSATTTVAALAPNDSIQVTFSPDFIFVSGFYTVTVYTQLASDANPANDTLEKIIEASTIDVGPVSIDIPATVPEDTTLNPQATVKNLGTTTETFPVTCTIEPGEYMKTQTIPDLLPGDSVSVTFFTPFTFTSGIYTVTVYTRHPSDDILTNDTLNMTVETHDPGIAEGNAHIPKVFSFNAPTVCRQHTDIIMAIPVATKVDLVAYDALGRFSKTLISDTYAAGTYSMPVQFNLPAGVYFYHLQTTSGERLVKKFLIVE
jgi:hypothetical protein